MTNVKQIQPAHADHISHYKDSFIKDVSMANPMSGYFTRKPVAYVVDNGSTLTFYYDTNKATHTGTGITIYGIDEKRTDDTDIPAWAGKYRNEIERTTKQF